MNGTIGPQARKVQEFARILEEHFRVPVESWDERLTTVAANRALTETGASRRKRRLVVDRIAATLILQGYMDRHGTRR
jgi:putative Holliday junction resolvase